jgi:phospholipase/lecithinase/hemolysin
MGRWSHALRWVGVLAGALLLASCGGGGEQVRKFVPSRVVSFGDENSLIEADKTKYTVNFIAAPTTDVPNPTIDCTQLPIWVQILANSYAVPFPQCPVTGIGTSPSLMLATHGAKVADVVAQIDSFLASNSFGETDLVTILAGSNDVLALYDTVVAGTNTLDQAASEAEARGTALAGQVNRVAQAGAKVLISTIPNLALTPYGRADAARSAALSRLSERFNSRLRVGLINDGHMIGLLLTDESFQSIVTFTSTNSTDPACNDATLANVRTCTSQTLRTVNNVPATASTHLWADNTHMSPVGHSALGSLALGRTANNPF